MDDKASDKASDRAGDRAGDRASDRAGDRASTALLLGTATGAVGGGLAHLLGASAAGDGLWAATALAATVPAVVTVVVGLRRREGGVDVVAALALVGALAVGEYFAGAVIAVMLATGRMLEARAAARAGRELDALLARAPRTAHRYRDLAPGAAATTIPPQTVALETVALRDVRPGDLLAVLPGEVVPVDGRVASDFCVLDESALTGEPLPVERHAGDPVRSGVVNAGSPFDLRATTTAEDSAYAEIVRLVSEAQADTAPFVRLANRYAAVFVPLALGLAGLAWAVSGEATRAVAVLVIATPCPLLLAAPIAIVAGLSRAAEGGVVVKGGAVLEQLARIRTLVFDKTGTVTAGRPTLARIFAVTEPQDEVLRLAASLDQVSPHVLGSAVVRAAQHRGLPLELPVDAMEVPGAGIRGRVGGREVRVGRVEWAAGTDPDPDADGVPVTGVLPGWVRRVRRQAALDEAVAVFVAVDGTLAGAVLFEDPIRPDAMRTVRRLRASGVQRLVLLTGDRAEVADSVAVALGLDAVLAERTPAEKVAAVRLERRSALTAMVGDGLNDAPALAAADVGIALGARGATASSQAADVVLTVDRLDRLAEAFGIARRARRIAVQSVLVGMGLAAVGMLAAAAGLLPPAVGALAQEGIDAAAILNALRTLTPERSRTPQLRGPDAAVVAHYLDEHRRLRPQIETLRSAADALDARSPAEALVEVRAAHAFLVEDLEPHEEAEERHLYPLVARTLGGEDPTGAMSRAHVEIHHLVRRLGRLLAELGDDAPDETDLAELRRVLYGLHAVLRLHFAQEEEGYFTLALGTDSGTDADTDTGTRAPATAGADR